MSRFALITGGTRGIGAAISIGLKKAGYNVVASCAGNTDAAAAFMTETGIKTYKWKAADYDACAARIAQVEADLGPVEILVNNGGITRDAPFHEMTRDQWQQVIDTNLSGVFNMTHPLWLRMRERKFGRIITISSINGQKGQFAQVNYSASQAGDLGLTKSPTHESARVGITAKAICPDYIATDMVMAMPQKTIDATIAQIPTRRLGEPEEIARCLVFLASEDVGFINGSTITPMMDSFSSKSYLRPATFGRTK